MLAYFNAIHQEGQQKIVLKGTFNEKMDNEKPDIFFQERIPKDDYFSPQRMYMNAEWQGQEFTLSLQLDKWKEKLGQNQIWDCYISYGERREKIQTDFKESIRMKHTPHIFYIAKPYVTNDQTLAISVKARKLSAFVTDTQIENQNLTLGFTIADDFYKKISNANQPVELELTFKKRIQADLDDHQDEKSFPVQQTDHHKFTSKVDLSTFIAGKTLAPMTRWDLFVTVKSNTGQTVTEHVDIDPDNDIFNQTFNLSSHLGARFVYDEQENFSLSISTDQESATIQHLRVNEQNVSLEGKVDNLIVDEAVLKKESAFANAERTATVMKLPVTEKDGTFNVTLPLEQFVQHHHIDDKDLFFINMKFRQKESKVKMNLPIYLDKSVKLSKKPIRVTNKYQVRLIRDGTNKLQFRNRIRTQEPDNHSLKVAVSGSCFSRLGFGSRDYYNPDYKNKYEVVYTQFHSSIISKMGKPVKFPEEKFSGMHPTFIDSVRSDFEKDFFKNLKQAKPDFFILDFYVDGSKDVLLFDDKHMITANYMLRKNHNYLHEIEPKVTVLNQKNIESYLEYWHKAIKKFCKKLVKYVPEERIILQKVRKAEGYYTKDGGFRKFKNQTYIQRSNYLFEYMENYFLTLLPNVRTIDLNDRAFYSHHKHPGGVTPDHYETNYYKEYMNRVDEHVLRYFIQHPGYLKKRKVKKAE